MNRSVVVCVDINSLLRYMRLASFLIGKTPTANFAGFVRCVPALFNTSNIGFHSRIRRGVRKFMTTFLRSGG
jgi:hypothetical protein